MPDLAEVVAEFGTALRGAGLPVGPDQCARFAGSVTVVNPATTRELYWCALATLVSDPEQVPTLERVFGAVFGGFVDPAEQRGQQPGVRQVAGSPSGVPSADPRNTRTDQSPRETETPLAAVAGERLAQRDFGELSAEELAELAELMRRFSLRTPRRRSRRRRPAARGEQVDLRGTLRRARQTGGYPVRLSRTTRRSRPRRLVVLCDVSGSMEPYARAMLQLVYCAANRPAAEVFAFATRLTRLTRALAKNPPAVALARAGRLVPDWSGGTRIAEAVKAFLDNHGRRGMARGAVVLIVSDGWDSGDPAELAEQMARLSRLAHRIVWANPRTARPRYQPLTGGMAAAWPWCDAVVSAHRLDALDDLLAALADPTRTRRREWRTPF